MQQFTQEPVCTVLLKGFWNLPWNEVSSWSAAGGGKKENDQAPSEAVLAPRRSVPLAGSRPPQPSPGQDVV